MVYDEGRLWVLVWVSGCSGLGVGVGCEAWGVLVLFPN